MICIQETKRESIDKATCHALWGDSDIGWEFQPAINTAGGLLCVWSQQAFKLERKEVGSGFILLEGVWLKENQKTSVKRILWDSLKQLRQLDPEGLWCFMGDFNSIRHHSERDADVELEEVPSVGKKFTWFKPNGATMSRLDRFLVSLNWIQKWPASTMFTLDRNFSDHCPIMLRAKDKSFIKADTECWTSNQPRGWGGFTLKVKIKKLKEALKVWNRDLNGDSLKKVQQVEAQLNRLEEESISRQLTPQEMNTRKMLQEELWAAALSHESLMRQKARVRWTKEGDCNSRYFHLLMNSRRTNNAVKGVLVDGSWVDDPAIVKEEIRSFFNKNFSEPDQCRPVLNGVRFKSIDQIQNDLLVGSFNADEIRAAVWDCGSEKSPGPDGLNFKFIKQFWENVKTIKSILRSFELVSGLKKNFAKSSFGVVGKSEQWQAEAARYLNCRILSFPFSYLGIPIGDNPSRSRDRLPTKMNLTRRQVVVNDLMCPLCGEVEEEAAHLFFNCRNILPLWWESLSWMGLTTAVPQSPRDHYLQHVPDFADRKKLISWKCWWIAMTWTTWKLRNRIVFQNAIFDGRCNSNSLDMA
ncbi:hypothetical protein GmHk_07G019845 [Glycine max]|nr:hypothetical protein GmHk_07G019845 [Glycine max]